MEKTLKDNKWKPYMFLKACVASRSMRKVLSLISEYFVLNRLAKNKVWEDETND